MNPESKYSIALCILIIILVGSMSGQDTRTSSTSIKNLGAAQSGNSIRISWQSELETGVDHYQLYRSSDRSGQFTCVKENISRLGNYQMYTIDDNCDLFKAEGRLFFYKVRAILLDGSSKESEAVSTYYSSTSSAAKRTWGSIKAMFR